MFATDDGRESNGLAQIPNGIGEHLEMRIFLGHKIGSGGHPLTRLLR